MLYLIFFLCVTLLEISDPISKAISYAPENLVDIQIPENAKSLQLDFSENAATLKSVEFLGSNIIRMKDSCFQYCEKLEKINLEKCEKLRVIPLKCFEFCTSLKSINIPISLKTISHSAFASCYSLEFVNITFQHEIEYIQPYAFYNCSLREFVIPDKINELSHMSMSCNTKLIEFKVNKAWRYNVRDQFLYDISDNWTTISFYPMGLPNKTVVIPHQSRCIRGGAFFGAINVEEFIFDDTLVTSLEQYAFSCCYNLKIVNLSQNGISFLGFGAFCNCTSLETVIFGYTRCYISKCCLSNNPNLKTVILPRYSMAISNEAFYLSDNIEKIVCPYKLKVYLVKIGFNESILESYSDLHVNIFSLNITRRLYRGTMPIYNINAADDFDDWREISFAQQPINKKKNKTKRPKIVPNKKKTK